MTTSYILHPTTVMISDLHVGDPENKRLEDFDRDADFERLLLDAIPRAARGPATLVIAGDFIDFPQILPELGGRSPDPRLGTTEAESLARMRRAVDGHPAVFGALARYLAAGGQVLVLPGNHDIDLHWPSVFEDLRRAVGGVAAPALRFVRGGLLEERGVYIEHGNQYAFDNRFERWEQPIIAAPDGTPRLERPWGTYFMDVVYNDLETLYPFVNKVYPHSRLATIILRLLCDAPGVAVTALARLAAFMVTRGRRFGWERLMGGDHDAGPPPSRKTVASFVASLGPDIDEARRAALIDEIAKSVGAPPGDAPTDGAPPVTGLLGRTDERGMTERADALLRSGAAVLVAFGHTHDAIDGNADPVFSAANPERVFNTGSWMPKIVVGSGEVPTADELAARPRVHDVRYLVIRHGNGEPPSATLERIAPT